MKLIPLFLFGLLLVGSVPAGEPPPVIRIEWDSLGKVRQAGRNPGLLFAAWIDGKIVWSQDQKKGGDPLFTAQLPAEKISALPDRWAKVGELSEAKFRRSYVGPDATYLKIALQLNGHIVALGSWHEGFEANPNLIAKSSGVTTLDGQKRDDALKGEPKDYLRFREIWQDVRQSTSALIPEKGEPYDEVVPALHESLTKSKK
jgi:hypothetical protein